jgi:hypothetical protein
LVTLFPEEKFGIVQLANAYGKARINTEIMLKLADAVLGIYSNETELARWPS